MKPATRSFYEDAAVRAAEYVVQNLDSALDLAELARSVNISPFHFHRIFRGVWGETPLELHRRLRLERAAWALCNTDEPITRIAFDAGYDTHEAFTRAFRARYAAAPSAFRTQQPSPRERWDGRVQTELASPSGIHYSPTVGERVSLPSRLETAPMNVTVTERPALRAAGCRHIGPYHRISEAFARLHAIAGPAGLARSTAQMIAIYYDDPETTPESELRADAALTVGDSPIPPGLTEIRIAPGLYACTTHHGPYTTLGDTWARLMGQWLPASGLRLGDGVTYELYRNTPADTTPENLRTELYVPVTHDA